MFLARNFLNRTEITKHFKPLPDLSNRLREYNNQIRMSRGPLMRTKIEARVISKRVRRNIIIWYVDKEPILTIWSHDICERIELIYNPPCLEYPKGHFDAYFRRKSESGQIFQIQIMMITICCTMLSKVCVNDEFDM